MDMMSNTPALRRRSLGQTMVELALILPLFIVLVIGVMELAFMLFKNGSLSYATWEGVRVASLNRTNRTNITTQVQALAYGIDLKTAQVKITTIAANATWSDAPPTVTIVTTSLHNFMTLGLIGVDSLTIKSEQTSVVVTWPQRNKITF